MEYRIITFSSKGDGTEKMNALAADGWRFAFMTDTRAYIVMERENPATPGQPKRPEGRG